MKFLVQDDLIVEGPLRNYPKMVTDENGVQHPLRELASKGYDITQYGWVDYTAPVPAYNPDTHKLGDITYSVVGGVVTGTYEIIPLTVEELEQVQENATAEQTKADTVLQNFLNAGPSGIDTYIDTNVTDMNSAKSVLKILAKIVWVLARNSFK